MGNIQELGRGSGGGSGSFFLRQHLLPMCAVRLGLRILKCDHRWRGGGERGGRSIDCLCQHPRREIQGRVEGCHKWQQHKLKESGLSQEKA